ncbi:Condenses 4-methyl-5-(beta-hydroxyethyl)thiazole monophosphate (THZ-P) and 2-methyl-4-amino-5-hydroxymethyl pyrimidine pyrophosphate (HMP-PP) to form thiamine monophosphate (TMP) [Vibrio sp. B1FIG11]|uniref:thiamine phosphate synthase n=1 Tax=Vibrio sp. B1FIG11 TaxID=2751177 RepID=UPI001AF3E3E6|nr:thiamine phosphate synthase [Vibrio sp. B1FIG11]CAD7819546.1 Condenses 4-methyl-5-(beta-hydroxyethyl)thiazole monophosphate (THZ-P) and 2-methyl-4-amino-5-hydroxymethyl pyrimidine pyrophosphate (HMP-PP) to form thiamine monophosphate (TMP) [Vibrio sp. B1FIG11]CAE6937000.1 Condenses 4-methyl-5-(beta-hydroxyethyl)thiazole monophosphate (THZ-P) and 2-methyl-4-amino-5-hydroxymethyl pyrimidine pyrophosphate (HMP-PP) to form thiamine monophosphate (TMP) [Vibrio sp. B1FIG11]
MNAYRLYLVTDDQQDLATLKRVVRKAVEGGVTMVQVREKHGDVRAFIERAQAVKDILKDTDVPLIVNDRVDVALAVDADGVHLGQSDMPTIIARELIGPNKILGLSIENEEQLAEADSLPIDYIGLSAIFATPTKTNTKKHWGIDGLKMALETTSLPIVAIGGINESNIPQLSATGVHGLALVSAICHAEDPKAASEYLLGLMS